MHKLFVTNLKALKQVQKVEQKFRDESNEAGRAWLNIKETLLKFPKESRGKAKGS